jgi:hypothetical protein
MRDMTRRGFFGLTAATAGGLALAPLLGGVAQADDAPTDTTTIYRFEPHPNACNACLGHRNKRFADQQAAEDFRAHKGCHCDIVPADDIATVAYKELYKDKNNVDLRDPQTADLIKTGGGTSVPVPIVTALPLVVLLGGGAAGYWFWHKRQDRIAAERRLAARGNGPGTPPAA